MKKVISLLLCMMLIGCDKKPVDINKAETLTPVINNNIQPTPVEVKNNINVPMHVDTLEVRNLGNNYSIGNAVKLASFSLSLICLAYVAKNFPWGTAAWEHARCIILAGLSSVGVIVSAVNSLAETFPKELHQGSISHV